MSFRPLFPRIAALAVLCAACSEQKSPANAAADTASAASVRANAAEVNAKASEAFRMPAAVSGHLTLTDAEVFFLPCGGAGKPQKVDDGTNGDAVKVLRAVKSPAGGLTSVVRLDGNRLTAVRFASADRMDCKDLPSRATVHANGNEPFWSVGIEGDLATYRTPWEPDGVVFQGGMWTRLDSARWSFVARRTGKGVEKVTLEFTEARCVDTMANAIFPFSVKLTRGDSTLTGCALEGRGAFGLVADTATAARTSSRARPSQLTGTQWRLAELNGEPVIDNVKATLEFARGGKASGSGSCNRFSGSVEVAGDSIQFGAFVSTRMACAEAAMRQEAAYLEALAKAERYAREGGSMLMYLKGGAKPLRFEPL